MKNERKSKMITIVALCVALVGLSVGFAAFSNVLTIKTKADVKPDASTFDIRFSSAESDVKDGNVSPVSSSGALATDAFIDNSTNSTPTIAGLHAKFTAPGQNVKYTFYVHNVGKYDAFLNKVTFVNVPETTLTKSCKAGNNTNTDMVAAACEGIKLSIEYGTDTKFEETTEGISSKSLAKGAHEKVVVTIEYTEGSALADGDFEISFGDIKFDYETVD